MLPYYRFQTDEANFVYGDQDATQLIFGLIALPNSSSVSLHVSGNRRPGNAYLEWPRVSIFSNSLIAVSLSEIGSAEDGDFEPLTIAREARLIATQSRYASAKHDDRASIFTVMRDGREIISALATGERTLQLSITWRQGHGAARLEVGSILGAVDAARADGWRQAAVEFDEPLQIIYSRRSSPN